MINPKIAKKNHEVSFNLLTCWLPIDIFVANSGKRDLIPGISTLYITKKPYSFLSRKLKSVSDKTERSVYKRKSNDSWGEKQSTIYKIYSVCQKRKTAWHKTHYITEVETWITGNVQTQRKEINRK